MSLHARLGVGVLSLGAGAILGLIGTFAHQSLPPFGVAIALTTVALYVAGLRLFSGARLPAATGVLGVGLTSSLFASAADGSVLVPANPVGYAWLGGIAIIAFIVLAWPHIQRSHRPMPDTIETSAAAPANADRAASTDTR
jgi:hypothetical protein